MTVSVNLSEWDEENVTEAIAAEFGHQPMFFQLSLV